MAHSAIGVFRGGSGAKNILTTFYSGNESALATISCVVSEFLQQSLKYNHLVANCLIFYNVCAMTRALHKMSKEGMQLNADTVSRLSPYLTGHMNRFGEYRFDVNRQPPPIDYRLPILGL